MSDLFVYDSSISGVEFRFLSNMDTEMMSKLKIKDSSTFRLGTPAPNGTMDVHMGSIANFPCALCDEKKYCPGHYGSVELKTEVLQPLFRGWVLKWLKNVCHNCGRLYLEKQFRQAYKKIPKEYSLKMYNMFDKSVSMLTDEVAKCEFCEAPRMHVFVDKNKTSIFFSMHELKEPNSIRFLFANQIRKILERITPETLRLAGCTLAMHPQNCIISEMIILPNPCRQELNDSKIMYNFDINSNISDIVLLNDRVPDVIDENNFSKKMQSELYNRIAALFFTKAKPTESEHSFLALMHSIQLVNLCIDVMINGSSSKNLKVVSNMNANVFSLMNQLGQRQGTIRKNFMGKRTEKNGRATINGDLINKVHEVGVPLHMAKQCMYREVVRDYNLAKLQVYFQNGSENYPGCNMVFKKSTQSMFHVKYMNKNYKLQHGDIVYRHLLDGDICMFNRQPSLLYSSISAMNVIVFKDSAHTFRHNVISCPYFNSDFDGDAMNIFFPSSKAAQNEIALNSKFNNWLVSYKDLSYTIGNTQDSLVGICCLTIYGVKLDRWHAMYLLGYECNYHKPLSDFDKRDFTGYDVVSMYLPNLSLRSKPQFYMEQFESIIKYQEQDKSVVIENGYLKNGILDKKLMGQQKANTIYQRVHNIYGAQTATQCIYNFQHLAIRFQQHQGFTVHLGDFKLKQSTRREVKVRTQQLIAKAKIYLQQLDEGMLLSPLGMQIMDFFELTQINALTPGDEFAEPILRDFDFYNNNMCKTIFSGSKGKINQFITMNGAVGTQLVDGHRLKVVFGVDRSLPFFQYFDQAPEARGYVSQSYFEGIDPAGYTSVCAETRNATISNALSTSVSGSQSRTSVKNLESLITTYLNSTKNGEHLLQPLYGFTGFDLKMLTKVHFDGFDCDEKEFELQFSCKDKFDDYDILLQNRNMFRSLKLSLEASTSIKADNVLLSPVDMDDFMNSIERVPSKLSDKDKADMMSQVNSFCQQLDYIYRNQAQLKKKAHIPLHYRHALNFIRLYIRNKLSLRRLLEMNFDLKSLSHLFAKTFTKCVQCLISPATCVGILAGQCASEPLVQMYLDSKHRAGAGAVNVASSVLDLFKEITSAVPVKKLRNPSCTVYVDRSIEQDKARVTEIMQYFSMRKLKDFKKQGGVTVLYDPVYAPVYQQFADDIPFMNEFVRDNPFKSKLSGFCIRVEFSKEQFLIRNAQLSQLIYGLKLQYDNQLYLIYTPDKADKLWLRAYFSEKYLSGRKVTEQTELTQLIRSSKNNMYRVFMELKDKFMNLVIGGIPGIKNVELFEKKETFVDPQTKKLDSRNIYGFYTDGSNLEMILMQDYIDAERTQSSSIMEMYDIFGVEVANQKIMNELTNLLEGFSPIHASLYSNLMTYTGTLTNVHKSGIKKRQFSDVFLRLSFMAPKKALTASVIRNLYNRILSISDNLMCGAAPNVGTQSIEVVLNENFVKLNNPGNFLDQL